MQIDIDGLHEKALLRLMECNSEKTGTGMTRILIRDAAKEAGVWPAVETNVPDSELQVTEPIPV